MAEKQEGRKSRDHPSLALSPVLIVVLFSTLYFMIYILKTRVIESIFSHALFFVETYKHKKNRLKKEKSCQIYVEKR
jgi:hypothetical protein